MIAHNLIQCNLRLLIFGRPMKSIKASLLHWKYWPNLKVAISPKLERPCPPKLVCMHLTSIPTAWILSRFQSITFFWWPWTVRKGNLAIIESSNISKTREAMSTKIGVHAFDINPYLHDFFLFNCVFYYNELLSK